MQLWWKCWIKYERACCQKRRAVQGGYEQDCVVFYVKLKEEGEISISSQSQGNT